MRSEGSEAVVDCNDAMIKAACVLDSNECPAACKTTEEETTEEAPKSGDLSVTAAASTDRKIIVAVSGAVSDTDTLTFKTSEEVSISKITLERYGFSDGAEVVSGVRLEDADGNVITEPKELNNKDQVTLTIKKDYRNLDGVLKATIVVETNTGSNVAAGGTMGFKVIDVQSTAKNLNLDNYKPFTYDLVVYGGTSVDLSRYGSDKDYNYEPNTMYEVARFRVSAKNSSVLINGFTLTNSYTGNQVDLKKYLDKVEVTANGSKISAKYSVNKDDQLVISLGEEYKVEAKKNVSFVVNLSLAGFEEYGHGVQFEVTANDLKAIEEKTDTRITVNPSTTETWAVHVFRGGKIKLTGTRLNSVDAAAGSINTVIAEGEITVGEAIKLPNFIVNASTGNVIEAMTLVVAGEEYDASHSADYKDWTFSKVVIEKSGKVQFKVDLKNEVSTGINEVTFTIDGKSSFGKASFSGATYEELRNETVNHEKDVSGTIQFTTLKVQAAKASLENTMSKSKAVEFLADKGDRKVVFEGTYTAKKGDITLTSFWFEGVPAELTGYLTLYVFVDGTEVGNVDTFSGGKTNIERFSDLKVKKDEVVKVKVEAEISSDIQSKTYPTKATFDLYLQGEDADGNDAGKGSDSIAPISVKDSGSVIIPSGEGSNTVKLRGRGESIAYFTVKPANGAEGIYLDQLVLTISGGAVTTDTTGAIETTPAQPAQYGCPTGYTGTVTSLSDTCTSETDPSVTTGAIETTPAQPAQYGCPTGYTGTPTSLSDTCSKSSTSPITSDMIKVNIGDEKDVDVVSGLTYKPNMELPKEGVVVEVILKDEATGNYEVSADVNSGSATKVFNRKFVDALVRVTEQKNHGDYTKYTLSVEKFDDTVSVTGLDLKEAGGRTVLATPKANVANGDTVSADNTPSSRSIVEMEYYVGGEKVELTKALYEDFFVDNNQDDLRVFANK